MAHKEPSGEPKNPRTAGKKKQANWNISENLRFLLNSHSEWLSYEKGSKVSTDEMVEEWLDQRLDTEERIRALKKLGITESDLPDKARKRG